MNLPGKDLDSPYASPIASQMLPLINSRRPHRKSKSGCVVCKRRKVKCDETRPSCKNCITYGETCEYAPIKPRNPPSRGSNSSNTPMDRSPSSFEDVHGSQKGLNSGVVTPTSLNLNDLELLHNFYTSTYATIHRDRTLHTLWRTNVAHLGLSHDFVMHAILSFSALHLAHFNPDKRHFYISQAMTHHQKGLEIATSAMCLVTEENCAPLLIFSILTCFFALARPRKQADFILVGETGLSEWLVILRGSGSIIDAAEGPLLAGPLGPLLTAGRRRDKYREQVFSEQHPIEAYQHLEYLTTCINNSPLPFAERQIYALSIEELRIPLAVIYGQDTDTYESGDVFVWVLRIPKEFLLLLRKHTQEALAIFSLFAVIVKPLEHNWWIDGLSLHLISTIYSLIDEEHREWIRWPMDEMGWVPPSQSFSAIDKVPDRTNANAATLIRPPLENRANEQAFLEEHEDLDAETND